MGMVKRGLNQLYGAVETVEGLGTTRERVRQMQQSLLSLRRVLSIFFQIVLVVIMIIRHHELVVPRKNRPLSDVGHSVIEYVIKSNKLAL